MAQLEKDSLAEEHGLQCMEIWGGTETADAGLSVPGMDGWVTSRPFQGDAAGGDIHYVSLCGHGMLSRFLVADVSGHGQVVASLAAELRGLMAQYVNTPDQTEFVSNLNQEFATLAEGGKFATAVVTSYYSWERQLVLCNAGHPHPLWYSAADDHWHPLHHETAHTHEVIRNLPLGVLAQTNYEQFAVGLGRGDLVVIYTDSLVEAEAPGRAVLGESGLLELARSIGARAPGELCRGLLAGVCEHAAGRLPNDDVTILTLRHTGAEPSA